jgi:hypothetical protein
VIFLIVFLWNLEAKKKIFFLPNWKKSSSFGKMLCPKKKKTLDQGDIAKLPNCQIAKSTSLSGLPANEFQAAQKNYWVVQCLNFFLVCKFFCLSKFKSILQHIFWVQFSCFFYLYLFLWMMWNWSYPTGMEVYPWKFMKF